MIPMKSMPVRYQSKIWLKNLTPNAFISPTNSAIQIDFQFPGSENYTLQQIFESQS